MSDAYSIQVTSENFETEVLRKSQETPVLVDFYADWCAPCKAMNPILKSVKSKMGDQIKILKINESQRGDQYFLIIRQCILTLTSTYKADINSKIQNI